MKYTRLIRLATLLSNNAQYNEYLCSVKACEQLLQKYRDHIRFNTSDPDHYFSDLKAVLTKLIACRHDKQCKKY